MPTYNYPSNGFFVSSCNSLAFKDGQVKGPCLKYQQAMEGKHASTTQAGKMWKK